MARVLVPLARGCEEVEAVTIIDLLRRADIEVITAGLDDQPVICSRGVCLIPDTTLEAVMGESFDMVVLPGGQPGADNLNGDERLHCLLARLDKHQGFIAAICAAPRVLATAGLLDHRRATSFPGALDEFTLTHIEQTGRAVETDGHFITSRGPGTAMDFALELVERLAGAETRAQVESGLQRPGG